MTVTGGTMLNIYELDVGFEAVGGPSVYTAVVVAESSDEAKLLVDCPQYVMKVTKIGEAVPTEDKRLVVREHG